MARGIRNISYYFRKESYNTMGSPIRLSLGRPHEDRVQ
jgi:hypothetical protein